MTSLMTISEGYTVGPPVEPPELMAPGVGPFVATQSPVALKLSSSRLEPEGAPDEENVHVAWSN